MSQILIAENSIPHLRYLCDYFDSQDEDIVTALTTEEALNIMDSKNYSIDAVVSVYMRKRLEGMPIFEKCCEKDKEFPRFMTMDCPETYIRISHGNLFCQSYNLNDYDFLRDFLIKAREYRE